MRMWPGMPLGVLLTLILGSILEGKEISSTINDIRMEILPDWTVPNGENLTLKCFMDISTTSPFKPQRTVQFYKNGVMFHNVSSSRDMESIFIPQARLYDSGTYTCTVILNNKERTTKWCEVAVEGVASPTVMLDKKEAIEGEDVAVTCSVVEERAPIHFMIEKLDLDTNTVKEKIEVTSRHDNFVTIKFPIEEHDGILVFRCQAMKFSGINMEISESIRSELLTVRESFSIPKIHVSPPGPITEGDELHIRCTNKVTHMAQEFPELLILKDQEIVASTNSNETVYSVVAMVEHSGKYTCKAESGSISKVSSIMVKVTAKQTTMEMPVEMNSSGNKGHRDSVQ